MLTHHLTITTRGKGLYEFTAQIAQWMSGLERYQNLVFFVMLLALILLAPNGLFGATFETRGSVIDWLRGRLRGGADRRNAS